MKMKPSPMKMTPMKTLRLMRMRLPIILIQLSFIEHHQQMSLVNGLKWPTLKDLFAMKLPASCNDIEKKTNIVVQWVCVAARVARKVCKDPNHPIEKMKKQSTYKDPEMFRTSLKNFKNAKEKLCESEKYGKSPAFKDLISFDDSSPTDQVIRSVFLNNSRKSLAKSLAEVGEFLGSSGLHHLSLMVHDSGVLHQTVMVQDERDAINAVSQLLSTKPNEIVPAGLRRINNDAPWIWDNVERFWHKLDDMKKKNWTEKKRRL